LTEGGELLDGLAELIRNGAKAQTWNPVDPEILSVFLFQMIYGVVGYAVRSGRMNMESLPTSMRNIVNKAVGRAEQSARPLPSISANLS
jgi:hypothetical protein